jgi:hypothetical protein
MTEKELKDKKPRTEAQIRAKKKHYEKIKTMRNIWNLIANAQGYMSRITENNLMKSVRYIIVRYTIHYTDTKK